MLVQTHSKIWSISQKHFSLFTRSRLPHRTKKLKYFSLPSIHSDPCTITKVRFWVRHIIKIPQALDTETCGLNGIQASLLENSTPELAPITKFVPNFLSSSSSSSFSQSRPLLFIGLPQFLPIAFPFNILSRLQPLSYCSFHMISLVHRPSCVVANWSAKFHSNVIILSMASWTPDLCPSCSFVICSRQLTPSISWSMARFVTLSLLTNVYVIAKVSAP